MRQRILLTLATTLLLPLFALAEGKVTVVIDYGDLKPSETLSVEWHRGMTALLALQHCAEVETHPLKQYIFVHTINGVRLTPAETAWYYEVNGRKATVIAFKQEVQAGDTVAWLYRPDICSPRKEEKK